MCNITDQTVATDATRFGFWSVAISCGIPLNKLKDYCGKVEPKKNVSQSCAEPMKKYSACSPDPDHLMQPTLRLVPNCSDKQIGELGTIRQSVIRKWKNSCYKWQFKDCCPIVQEYDAMKQIVE